MVRSRNQTVQSSSVSLGAESCRRARSRAFNRRIRCSTRCLARSRSRILVFVRRTCTQIGWSAPASSACHSSIRPNTSGTNSVRSSWRPRGSIHITDSFCSAQRRIMSWLDVTTIWLVIRAWSSTTASPEPRGGALSPSWPTWLALIPSSLNARATRQESSSSKSSLMAGRPSVL